MIMLLMIINTKVVMEKVKSNGMVDNVINCQKLK